MTIYKNTETVVIDNVNTFEKFGISLSRFSGLSTNYYMKKFGVLQGVERNNKFEFVKVLEIEKISGNGDSGKEVTLLLKSSHGEFIEVSMGADDFILETHHRLNEDNSKNKLYFSILFTHSIYEVTVYGSNKYNTHLENFKQQELNNKRNSSKKGNLYNNFDNENYLQKGNRYLEIHQRTPFHDERKDIYLAVEYIYLGNGRLPLHYNYDLSGFNDKGHRLIVDVIHLIKVPNDVIDLGKDEIDYYMNNYINKVTKADILNNPKVDSFSLIEVLDNSNVKNIETVSTDVQDLLYGYNYFRNMDIFKRVEKDEIVKDINEGKLTLLKDKYDSEDITNTLFKVKSTINSISNIIEFRTLFYNFNYLKGNTFYLDRALSYILFNAYIGWYLFYIVENNLSDDDFDTISNLIGFSKNNRGI